MIHLRLPANRRRSLVDKELAQLILYNALTVNPSPQLGLEEKRHFLNKSIGPISSKNAGFLQDFEKASVVFRNAEYAVARRP
jgi:hypothetical protein